MNDVVGTSLSEPQLTLADGRKFEALQMPEELSPVRLKEALRSVPASSDLDPTALPLPSY
jgi:hypothetical protein